MKLFYKVLGVVLVVLSAAELGALFHKWGLI